MEDSFQCIQDLNIDEDVSVTYYAVFDGHGGPECANFLKDNLHIEIKSCLQDSIEGIKDSEDLNDAIYNCILRSFENCDSMYKKIFPEVAN